MTGWLLVGVALSFVSQATPLGPEAPSVRDAVRVEGSAVDRRLVREVAQEMQRSGAGVAPSVLGSDAAFLGAESMLDGVELREEISDRLSSPGRPRSVRNLDTGGPDAVVDAVNSALKATRDALFEGGDTANFSLAGIDLSVTLRGDRRGVSVNGYDMLASNQYGAQSSDALLQKASATVGGTYSEIAVRQYNDQASDRISLEDIRKFVSEPMTIVGILAFFAAWAVLAVASSRRG